ncbi:hypothetical protein PSHT_16054 [Puccinia striiformis]|uniref:DUF6589 domain-containing protein n=2 Tax=Puccinia striiformis TaxID=27350 RepID=A0A0L0VZB0_9BASI|nr:hypothetical protein PSTG_02075 [Puccinia striiformis f. sp. tritici PST-78]POV94734.1 hypothetical protein PSHT_16054 [Puccinia striiformis]
MNAPFLWCILILIGAALCSALSSWLSIELSSCGHISHVPFYRDYTFNKDDPTTESIPVIPTEAWNQAIKKCYEAYCSPAARRKAAQLKCPKLSNLLIRIKDFLTGVEANRAMKAGDIGRLLRVWKMWSIMTQSLPGLTHYSAYLPRLVLLITRILPPSLAKLIRHTLLLSPSGVGTQIERLKNLFSSNIPLLCSMFKSLRRESGGKHVQQSHKVYLKIRALQRFDQMARDSDLLD